jgi:hypothetical protein
MKVMQSANEKKNHRNNEANKVIFRNVGKVGRLVC